MTNYLRPDEMATESEIRKAKNRTNEVNSVLGAASSFGTAAIGKKVASKVLPFLSQYVPEDLAFKGINKVMPALGKFLKNGMSQGLSLKSGLDYLKNEFTQQGSKQEPAKQNRNIIQQYSPELHQFMDEQIKNGRSPLEAGALAQHDKRFGEAIKKLSKDHKTPWSSILESVYGTGETAQPQQSNQQTQQQQLGQGQTSQGQQMLMEALKMSAESRKRRQR
jgi:hypothetical protein